MLIRLWLLLVLMMRGSIVETSVILDIARVEGAILRLVGVCIILHDLVSIFI